MPPFNTVIEMWEGSLEAPKERGSGLSSGELAESGREEKRRRERKEIVLWQNSYSGWSHEDLKGWLVRASLNQDWPRELCTVVASPPF